MIRLLHGLIGRLVYASVVALVLVAVLITLVRLGLPLAGGLRDELAAGLSERLGHPVRIERLSLRLSGWSPRLVIDGLRLGKAPDADPAGDGLLRLDALEMDLNLAETLHGRRLSFGALTLVGPRLELRRLADGGFRISGLDLLKPGKPGGLAGFLAGGRLNLIDGVVEIVDDTSGAPLARFDDLRLQMRNEATAHRLVLFARPVAPGANGDDPPGPGDARLRLLADLEGAPADPARWGGRAWLSLQGKDLGALVPHALNGWKLPRTGSALVETWIGIVGGTPREILARVGLRGMRLPPLGAGGDGQRSGGLRVDGLSGTLRAAPLADGWSVGVRDLALSLEGLELPGLALDLDVGAEPELAPRRLALVAGAFDLGLAGRLLEAAGPVLPETAAAPVERMLAGHPRGRLDRLTAVVEDLGRDKPRWRLKARVSGFGIDNLGGIPGVEGLDLLADADQDGGALGLGSEDLVLDLAPTFDRPIRLDQLGGRVGWSREPDGSLRLESHHLAVENADLRGNARFSLELPRAGTSPVLDLTAEILDADGARFRDYLPVGRMGPQLVAWLERALVGGKVPKLSLSFSGPVNRYPFRDGGGRFELNIDLQDAVLDYLDGWPPLTDIRGSLRFFNQRLTIALDSGRIYDTEVLWALAALPELWRPPHIDLHGELKGPFSDGQRILAETPLAKRLGPLAGALSVDGESRLSLDLSVPFKKGERLAVLGRLHWPGPARIELRGTPLTLTDLGGILELTGNSIAAERITAKLWGEPLTLSLATRDPGDDSVSEINAHSRLPVSALAAHLPAAAWALAGGDAELDLAVRLRNAELGGGPLPLRFDLRSDLAGLSLDLPRPLGKAAGTKRSLALGGTLVAGRTLDVSGTLGDLGLALGIDIAVAPPSLTRGRVRLGGGAAPELDGQRELLVDGRLPDLRLADWTSWWERAGARLSGDGQDAAAFPDVSADLVVDRLDLGALAIHEARIRSTPARPAALQIEARELAGDVLLPGAAATRPLALELQRLDLAAFLSDEQPGNAVSAPAGKQRQSPPELDLRVAHLGWRGHRLGRLDLGLRRDGGEMRVPEIRFNGVGGTRIDGSASWPAASGGGRGRLALSLESRDPGALLKALDYADAIAEAPTAGSVDLTWPGGLDGFSLARAAGTIGVESGAGRLLEVEPGVGRVLGFLNLGALGRRLSLDFTDLYDEGFAFESVVGEIRLADGKAYLDRFVIDGPAGEVRVSGSTNLETRTFDQEVAVEPRIGTGVALAGAVAGGPVVGAAVFIADKVTGGTLDRLATYRYRVTGPWSEPTLTRIGWDPFGEDGAASASDSGSAGERGAGPVDEPGDEPEAFSPFDD